MAWDLEGFAASLTGVSSATRDAYRRDLVAFTRWTDRLGLDGPEQVDRRTLRRYLAFLSTTGKARRSIARAASSLRRYFGWLRRTGRLEADPSVGLSAPSGDGRLPRVLPEGVGAEIRLGSWPVPPLFDLVRQVCTAMDDHELYRTLNMGIGMVIVCAPEDVAAVQASIGERTWVIGELVAGEREVALRR